MNTNRNDHRGALYFFCGKMGAGKSTLAKQVSTQGNMVLIVEDEWLGALYPSLIQSVADYVTYSARLKQPMTVLTQQLLLRGQDVALDFPANTIQQRASLKQIAAAVGCLHHMYYLDVADEVCLGRIKHRRQKHPSRADTDTAEMFHAMRRHFRAPQPDEGLNLLIP